MDWIDGLLGIGLTALMAVLFGMVWSPYGYVVGALAGAFFAWQALKRRRRMIEKHKE